MENSSQKPPLFRATVFSPSKLGPHVLFDQERFGRCLPAAERSLTEARTNRALGELAAGPAARLSPAALAFAGFPDCPLKSLPEDPASSPLARKGVAA